MIRNSQQTVVGIDSGGTNLTVRVGTLNPAEPTIGIRVSSVPPTLTTWNRASAHLIGTIHQALRTYNHSTRPAAIFAAIAGAGNQESRTRWERELRAAFPSTESLIQPDYVLALEECGKDLPAVATVVGTGTCVVGRLAPTEPIVTADGWGFLFGDRGSSFAIGLSALRAVLSAHDGTGPQTRLTEQLLKRLSLANPGELPSLIVEGVVPVSLIAALAAEVIAIAGEGDEVAIGIVGRSATAVSRAIVAVVDVLQVSEYRMGIHGGLITSSGGYRRRVLDLLDLQGRLPVSLHCVKDSSETALSLARVIATT